LLAIFSFAQQTVSFEDSEGFISGNIHGQGAWISTPTGGNPENIIHQTISTDDATDGSSALKIVRETIYGVQSEPVIGGFYNLITPLTSNHFSVSFDINMSELDGSVFGFQGVSSIDEQMIVRVDFDKTGIIKILDKSLNIQNMVSTAGIWAPNTWYRFKVVGAGMEIRYYFDNSLIHTETSVAPIVMDQLRFVHNNGVGTAYIDNIKINQELVMAVKETKADAKVLTVYPNPVTDYLHLVSQSKMNDVEIFNSEGRRFNVVFSDGIVDVRDLQSGIYFIKIILNNEKYYYKFIKR
jgi:hypothetical protein